MLDEILYNHGALAIALAVFNAFLLLSTKRINDYFALFQTQWSDHDLNTADGYIQNLLSTDAPSSTTQPSKAGKMSRSRSRHRKQPYSNPGSSATADDTKTSNLSVDSNYNYPVRQPTKATPMYDNLHSVSWYNIPSDFSSSESTVAVEQVPASQPAHKVTLTSAMLWPDQSSESDLALELALAPHPAQKVTLSSAMLWPDQFVPTPRGPYQPLCSPISDVYQPLCSPISEASDSNTSLETSASKSPNGQDSSGKSTSFAVEPHSSDSLRHSTSPLKTHLTSTDKGKLQAWVEWNRPTSMPSKEVVDGLSHITNTHRDVIKAWLEKATDLSQGNSSTKSPDTDNSQKEISSTSTRTMQMTSTKYEYTSPVKTHLTSTEEAKLQEWLEWNQPTSLPTQEIIRGLSHVTNTHKDVIKAWLERHIV